MRWIDDFLSRPTRIPRIAWLPWLGVLGGLLLCGPLVVIAAATGSRVAAIVAMVVFVPCFLLTAGSMLVYQVRHLSGAYRNLPERPWRDQVW